MCNFADWELFCCEGLGFQMGQGGGLGWVLGGRQAMHGGDDGKNDGWILQNEKVLLRIEIMNYCCRI